MKMNIKNKSLVYKQCITALCVAMNIIGSFVAMGLRLPVYLDSMGTVLISGIFGLRYGVITGILSNLINGISFDVYSFYYIPVQIFTACMASYVMRSKWSSGWRSIFGAMVISVPVSFVSACITAVVFGGITSSGSSYLVLVLRKAGMGLTFSCFVVQMITDYLDKLITIFLVRIVMKRAISGKIIQQERTKDTNSF